jgi:hypothetical protein
MKVLLNEMQNFEEGAIDNPPIKALENICVAKFFFWKAPRMSSFVCVG